MLFGNFISDSVALLNHVKRNVCDLHGFVQDFHEILGEEQDKNCCINLYICCIILANRKFDLDESSKLQSLGK